MSSTGDHPGKSDALAVWCTARVLTLTDRQGA